MNLRFKVPELRLIAYDIGGIFADDISNRHRVGDRYANPVPAPYSLDVLSALTRKLGPNRQAIISRITPGPGEEIRRQANLDFLKGWGFHEAMGMTDEHLLNVYIGDREEKGQIARRIGANLMIDDRLECLQSMPPDVSLVIMNPKNLIVEITAALHGRNWCFADDWRHVGTLLGLDPKKLRYATPLI